MNTTRAVAVGLALLLVASGAGAASVASSDENPACDSPNQGFVNSVEGSIGTSLERAGPGLVNSREKVGCKNVYPS